MVSGSSLRDSVLRAAHSTREYAARRDFTGSDPYAGLIHPAARAMPSKFGRRVITQAFKRAPSVLHNRVRLRMAKSLALFALGDAYLRDLNLNDDTVRLCGDLKSRQTPQGGWAYEFDVQVRWDGYAAGQPNVPASDPAVCALARNRLLDPDTASSVLRWFTNRLWNEDGKYCRYVSSSDTLVHNGSLLGLRMAMLCGANPHQVSEGVTTSLAAQGPDGSWPYGASDKLAWNDSFHTVNILEALMDLRGVTPEAHDHLARGVDHWLSFYFDRRGRVQYFPRGGPIDIHNIATSLFGLAKLAAIDSRCESLILPNLHYLLSLQGSDGGFRSTPSAPAFMRWNQAHAYHALAYLASKPGLL